MRCNHHSFGAMLLILGVSLAGLLLAYGATSIALHRDAGERITVPAGTILSSPEKRWVIIPTAKA